MSVIESLMSARLFLSPQRSGDRIYFISNLSGRLSLHAMNLDGSRILRVWRTTSGRWAIRVRLMHESEKRVTTADRRAGWGIKPLATTADLFRALWGHGLDTGQEDLKVGLARLMAPRPPNDDD